MGADATVYDEIDPSVTTEFVGYDKLETASTVTVLTSETEIVEALSDGEIGTIIVEETPFYATMGGQQGDKGVIYTADGTFKVEDTIRLLGGKVGHVGKMTSGMIKSGDELCCDGRIDLIINSRICSHVVCCLTILSCCCTLYFHRLFEAVFVNREAFFF